MIEKSDAIMYKSRGHNPIHHIKGSLQEEDGNGVWKNGFPISMNKEGKWI